MSGELLLSLKLVVAGLIVAGYGTMIGSGGGFLLVPLLLMWRPAGASTQQVIGTSLTVVCFNALPAAFCFFRQKRIDFATAWKFALATIPGSILGAWISRGFRPRGFELFFGLLLFALALLLLSRRRQADHGEQCPVAEPLADFADLPRPGGYVRRRLVDANGDHFVYAFHEGLGILLSFFIGFLSSALGVGGGIVHVPALIMLFHFPPHIAIGTSQFILAISAVVGTAAHALSGHVLLRVAIPLGLGGVAGAFLGAALARRAHSGWIVRLLALALVVLGTKLVWGAVFP